MGLGHRIWIRRGMSHHFAGLRTFPEEEEKKTTRITTDCSWSIDISGSRLSNDSTTSSRAGRKDLLHPSG